MPCLKCQKRSPSSELDCGGGDAVAIYPVADSLPCSAFSSPLYNLLVWDPERFFTSIMDQRASSLVPGTPVHVLFPPRARSDPLTGYEPNRPRSPRGQPNPYRAASPAAPLRPPGIPMDRVPFYSSLVFLDERIHLQVGQEEETAARRLYEVNQYHLYEERESLLRRNWKRSNLRRRSLYKLGSTCNTGSRKRQLHLLLGCKLQKAT